MDHDVPLTLNDACRIIFGNAIKPATLMAEAKRGKLQMEKIGRRYFVTSIAIKEMRNKCLVDRVEGAHIFGSSQSVRTTMVASNDHGGSSATDRSSAARDSLQITLLQLKKPSRNT